MSYPTLANRDRLFGMRRRSVVAPPRMAVHDQLDLKAERGRRPKPQPEPDDADLAELGKLLLAAAHDGDMDEGVRTGHGRLVLLDGSTYEGQYLGNAQHGHGRYTMPCGTGVEEKF